MRTLSNMRSNFVSLHPYFKVHPGKLVAVKAGFARFMEKTATEKDNLFYGFSVNGDEIFCREAYESAEGVLAHLDNIGALARGNAYHGRSRPRRIARPRGRAQQTKSASRTSQSSVVHARVQPTALRALHLHRKT